MQYGRYVLALLIGVLVAVPFAFSQEPTMTLNHTEIGPHERPLVQFNHEQHSSTIDCQRCHHDYDANGNNKGGEGQPCSECHAKASDKGGLMLVDAFHYQCKSCHEEMRAEGKASGPVMCGECHVRR